MLRIKQIKALTLVSIGLFALGGCAGAPTERAHYTLPVAQEGEALKASPPDHTLIVDSLQLASYLDSQGIVFQQDDIQLQQAEAHLWAEELDRQLQRGLRQRLSHALSDTRVLRGGNAEDALHLRLEVERFQGRYDGMAVAGGHWLLRDAEGKVIAMEPFNVEVALEEDGYPALVRALGKGWNQVATDIAERIEALR